MKKLFTFVSALALSVMAFASTTVTMDFSDPTTFGYAKAENGKSTQVPNNGTVAQDGVVLTASYTSGNGIVFFTHSTNGTVNLRGYVGAKLTVTPPEGKKLLKIKATGSNLNTTYLQEGDGKMGGATWEGEADAVVLDIIKSTVQINSLSVEYGNAGETPAEVKVDTITVSQAIERIKKNQKGECYVKGVVAGDPFDLGSGNPAFYLTDIKNPADSLEGYKIKKSANTAYASADEMAADFEMGDTILIYADGLDFYQSKNIYETTGGYFCKMLGKYAATVLDWAVGSAYLGENGWTLEIQKANNDDKNIASFKIASSKKDAIAGSYQIGAGSSLTLDGSNSAITAGSIQLTFIKVGTTSQNEYQVRATFTASEKIYRIKKDVPFFASDAEGNDIVLKGDRPFTPTEGQEITCAEAVEYGQSLANGATGTVSVVVKGYVTKIEDANTFWMDDQKGNKQTFEVYKFKQLTPEGQTVAVGAEVKVTGYITKFNDKTIESKDCAVEIISGGTEVKTIKATVAEAITACQALANNAVTTDLYEVEAFISEVAYAYSAEFGNISLWLSDNQGDGAQTFQAYRAKCDAAIADQLVAGARVVVTGNLKKQYDAEKTEGDGTVKPERTILEIVNGTVVLKGTAVDIINADVKVVKFIENGQIYILRNGVRYNLQGQIAE